MSEITGPAWQIRESQRQRFLEGLMREAWGAADELAMGGDREFFKALSAEIICFVVTPSAPWISASTHDFLANVVVPLMRTFSRSHVEREALLARFLEEHVLPEALSHRYRELRHQELEDPELVFHAKRATDEVTVTVG